MELSKDDVRVIAEALALFAELHPEFGRASAVARHLALEISCGKDGLTSDELILVDTALRVFRDELDDMLDDPEVDRDSVLSDKKSVNALLRKLRPEIPAEDF